MKDDELLGKARICALSPADLGWVLPLNKTHESELSPLSMARLGELVDAAFYAAGADAAAFLLAFDETGHYDSPNFLWFRARFERFVYVDRIAVAPHARGRGLARLLYEDLFRRTRQTGRSTIVCEVNTVPANPSSDAFHDRLGFTEVGRAVLEDRKKSVRYLYKAL